MIRILRWFALASALSLSAPAFGQGQTTYPGGTLGPEHITVGPPPPELEWQVFDGGPDAQGVGQAGDGQRDNISTVNGTRDVISCGIEDAVQADPEDYIAVHTQLGGAAVWQGTYDRYLYWKAFILRSLELLGNWVSDGLGLLAAIDNVSTEYYVVLLGLPDDPGLTVSVSSYFAFSTFLVTDGLDSVPEAWTVGAGDVSAAQVEALYFQSMTAEQLALDMQGALLVLESWSSDL